MEGFMSNMKMQYSNHAKSNIVIVRDIRMTSGKYCGRREFSGNGDYTLGDS